MKKIMSFIFFGVTIYCFSQEKPTQLSINLSSGISIPSSNFSNESFASNGTYIEASGSYFFSKFGVGLSLGQFKNSTKDNLNSLTNSLDFTASNTFDDWSVFYYGFGPEYRASINKINASFLARTGIMAVQPINIQSTYNQNVDVSIPFYKLNTPKTSKISYFSTAIKIGYVINNKLSLFASANYLSAMSNELTLTESIVHDNNGNGTIDLEDIVKYNGADIALDITSKNIKPQYFNFGIGLSYSFGNTVHSVKRKRPGRTKYSNITLERKQTNNPNTTNVKRKRPGRTKYSNITLKRNSKKDLQKLVNISPKNNSSFKSSDELKKFTWQIIGEQISNPNYIIEVVKVGYNQKAQQTYIKTTSKTSINANVLFKNQPLNEGTYRWTVTETTSGTSSTPSYFTYSNCDVNFTISNDTIQCLGYEGADRRFKICFDATYASTTGDLTFNDALSGLTVWDQTYASIPFTLVAPNSSLVPQTGASGSTVSYCFEVTVSSSVTSIGFGLQGDDLDPSPTECKPGVSLTFDELPSCICDECGDKTLSFDNFNISPNGATGNQFNLNGDINVNVPIYGIEFQIQSYSYSSAPSACSQGVSSIEESGMFLMPGTTINGSSTLQLFNETASNNPNSNNNATKAIKYTSTTPLSGPIPVNLTIGLPGPISGLDASCCTMTYTVCIKVRIFYENGNCKSCVFTHCFQFNNQ